MSRILLVEDDPFISEIYIKKFAASGFEVVPALTGKEALKKALDGSYDAVMLDMVLPELSGIEVLRELRANKDYDPNLKVLIFSNLSGPEERQEALDAGASGFISKTDFTPSEVVTEVERHLGQFASQTKHAVVPAETPATNTPRAGDGASPEGGKHILLIEEEPVFGEMFGKALRDAGFSVVIERHGQRALDRASAGDFDLVITAHFITDANGAKIVDALRRDERTKTLPIFVLSAALDETELKELAASGKADRSFSKTKVTPGELASAVTSFLSQ